MRGRSVDPFVMHWVARWAATAEVEA